jgi:hypothetical protein
VERALGHLRHKTRFVVNPDDVAKWSSQQPLDPKIVGSLFTYVGSLFTYVGSLFTHV